jgi:hypothetical protein
MRIRIQGRERMRRAWRTPRFFGPFTRPDSRPDPAQQARIRSFVREAPDRREPAVDRPRRKLTRFQVDSITGGNGLIERQSGFSAVPGDELVYRLSVKHPGSGDTGIYK